MHICIGTPSIKNWFGKRIAINAVSSKIDMCERVK